MDSEQIHAYLLHLADITAGVADPAGRLDVAEAFCSSMAVVAEFTYQRMVFHEVKKDPVEFLGTTYKNPRKQEKQGISPGLAEMYDASPEGAMASIEQVLGVQEDFFIHFVQVALSSTQPGALQDILSELTMVQGALQRYIELMQDIQSFARTEKDPKCVSFVSIWPPRTIARETLGISSLCGSLRR